MEEQFFGTFGDERLLVEISKVNGAGATFHVFVNKRYQGMIFQTQNGEYTTYIDGQYITQGDDIDIIVDIVKRLKKESERLTNDS